jgi:hypothetical protein
VLIFFSIVAFVVALGTITYATAFVADITGTFRLLFIDRRFKGVCQALRWLMAAALAGLFLFSVD